MFAGLSQDGLPAPTGPYFIQLANKAAIAALPPCKACRLRRSLCHELPLFASGRMLCGSWPGAGGGERLPSGLESVSSMRAFGLRVPIVRCGDMTNSHHLLVAGGRVGCTRPISSNSLAWQLLDFRTE